MKKINLSNLRHKELPTKLIKAVIGDEEQEFSIYPVSGRGITSIGLISDDDVDKNSKLCLLALIYGLKISQAEAEILMNEETLAADSIAAEVLKFTEEYSLTLNAANDEIKKNSKKKTTK